MPRKVKSSKKPRNKSLNFSSMLQNKMMLYLSLTLFIFNVLAFMFFKDMQSLFLFVIILCITYLFDQNMIIVLLTPTLFVGLLIFLRKSFMNSSVVEGFKENHDPQPQNKEDDEEKDEDKEEDKEEDNNDETGESDETDETSEENNNDAESYANLKSKKNQNIKEELSNLVSNYEKAQKGFNETLEKTKLDPQSLETQKEMIKQMNQITPVIKDSVKILNKVDMNGLNNLVGSLGKVIGHSPFPKPMNA